jgi:TolB-like protein/Tfp pilus assembly protein PilF
LEHEAEIRAQLEKILASPGFSKGEKLQGFLRLIVENALTAGSEPLKEYSIAVNVYRRRDDFDPRMDSTVRSEAVRLRSRLGQYYDGPGKDDPIRIGLPRGSYVPQFEWKNQGTAAEEPIETPSGGRSRVWAFATTAAILCGIAFWWIGHSRGRQQDSARISSIAVLKFATLNADEASRQLAGAIRGQIVSELAQVNGLRVSASEAAVGGERHPGDWAQLGRKLNVTAFVQASVRRDGNKVDLTAELISTDGFHIWAGTFEREGQDASSAGREAVHSAVSSLRQRFGGSASVRHLASGSNNPEAVKLYLEAFRQPDRGEVRPAPEGSLQEISRCIDLLHQSLAIDPAFAQAWGALGRYESRASDYRQAGWRDHLSRAKQAAAKALELDDSLAEAHFTLGAIALLREYDLQAAYRHLKRAVELEPRDGAIHHYYGSALSVLGRFDEAIEEISRAQVDEPNKAGLSIDKSEVYFLWHKYSKSEEEARRALAMVEHGSVRAEWALGVALQYQGKLDEAERELRKAYRQDPKEPRVTVALAQLLFQSGRAKEAESLWKQGEKAWQAWGGMGNTGNAYYAAIRGRNEEAIDLLYAGYEAQESSFPYFLVDPRFDGLRSMPRFQELVRQVRSGQHRFV